jgi:hypothetical protein
MNEPNPNQPPYPPQATPNIPPPPILGSRPLGEDPTERESIPNVVVAIESLLRQPRRLMFQLRQPGAGKLIAGMLLVAILCSAIYGVIVGSFSGGDQWWAAPVKVTCGLLISALICLPSLYIFTSLSGAQARLVEIFGLVIGLLMLMTILLIGFAPVAWLFSQSTQSLAWMGFLHLLFWGISTAFGLRFLQAGFAHAKARSSSGLNTWALIFVLVVLQMTTALRPIVGPTQETFLPKEKVFFLTHWFKCMEAGAR